MKYLIAIIFFTLLIGCNDQNVESAQNPLSNSIEAPAELISLKQATVGPPSINRMWQYKIQYLVAENSIVKKGDVIVRLDTEQLESLLFDEQSKLAAAMKEQEKQALDDSAKQQDLLLALAEADMEYERAQRKVAITDEARSAIERDKQRLDFEIAKQVKAQTKASLDKHEDSRDINNKVSKSKVSGINRRINELKSSIDKLTITAPKDGLVVYQSDWQGNKPATGETIPQGRTIMTLPSIDQLAVKAEFDESDTSSLSVGQQVKVTLDAHPERPFAGKIVSLGQAYRHKSQNNLKVVFDATIRLSDAEQSIMRPGMKARVTVTEAKG